MINDTLRTRSGNPIAMRAPPLFTPLATRTHALRSSHVTMFVRESRRLPSRVALHEAGHAIGCFANGYSVRRLRAGDTTGACYPLSRMCDRVAAIVAACGALAEGIGGDDTGRASWSDEGMFSDTLGARDARAVLGEAQELLACHRDEVIFLAYQLEAAGSLDTAAIGRLCRQGGSALAAYARFYPAARQSHSLAPRLPSQNVVSGAGLFC